MPTDLPNQTLVVVTTGAEAKLFRNTGQPGEIKLKSAGELSPQDLLDDGPAGVRPPESSPRENDEATFSKQLAEYLYKQSHSGEFQDLAIIADPDTLGELRPILHKEVANKVRVEINKTLVNSNTSDIERALGSA